MKRGFTLAETLITVTVLGIIAAITIPAMISRHNETANKTKIKKAMSAYETAFNKMVIENSLKSDNDIDNFAGGDCAHTRAYFKSSQDGANNCSFKTSDGLWWNIADIKNPLVMVNNKYLDTDRDELLTLAKSDPSENKEVFAFVGRVDTKNGTLRINDRVYEAEKDEDDYPTYLAKLYSYINNTVDLDLKYSKPCQNDCDVMGYMGGGSSGCSGCSYEFSLDEINANVKFDEEGNLYKADYTLPDEEYNGETITVKGVLNKDLSYTFKGYYSTGEKATVQDCPQLNPETMGCAVSFSCIRNYNKDGSLDYQSGDGCE